MCLFSRGWREHRCFLHFICSRIYIISYFTCSCLYQFSYFTFSCLYSLCSSSLYLSSTSPYCCSLSFSHLFPYSTLSVSFLFYLFIFFSGYHSAFDSPLLSTPLSFCKIFTSFSPFSLLFSYFPHCFLFLVLFFFLTFLSFFIPNFPPSIIHPHFFQCSPLFLAPFRIFSSLSSVQSLNITRGRQVHQQLKRNTVREKEREMGRERSDRERTREE